MLTLSEFEELASSHTVVPVWRSVMADTETPVTAFTKLVGSKPGFLLESVEHAKQWGRFSFIGRDPLVTLTAHGRDVSVEGDLAFNIPRSEGILAALEALIAQCQAPHVEELPPFHGGVAGYLGYDVVREIERLPDMPPDAIGWPDAIMSLTGHITAFDHFRQRMFLIENVVVGDTKDKKELQKRFDLAQSRLDQAEKDLAVSLTVTPEEPPAENNRTEAKHNCSLEPGRYEQMVNEAKEYILAGDIFQVVLSQRFDLEDDCDPFSVYRALRLLNPSPYMYIFQHPETTVVGSSPEPMVQVREGRVISRPIAGTRPRGQTEAEDQQLADQLQNDPKEQAEHVMLLDLARNDVGRVVEFGSETVEELMTLERYSHVMHLTSQASGKLVEGKNVIDVLRATFPAGTVSGAPKVRAMEIIDELEPTKRGPYGGVVGYLDFSGNLDTAITIRTMVWRNGHASVQAAAGLVADSDPAREGAECHSKARALLVAAASAQQLAPFRVS